MRTIISIVPLWCLVFILNACNAPLSQKHARDVGAPAVDTTKKSNTYFLVYAVTINADQCFLATKIRVVDLEGNPIENALIAAKNISAGFVETDERGIAKFDVYQAPNPQNQFFFIAVDEGLRKNCRLFLVADGPDDPDVVAASGPGYAGRLYGTGALQGKKEIVAELLP